MNISYVLETIPFIFLHDTTVDIKMDFFRFSHFQCRFHLRCSFSLEYSQIFLPLVCRKSLSRILAQLWTLFIVKFYHV